MFYVFIDSKVAKIIASHWCILTILGDFLDRLQSVGWYASQHNWILPKVKTHQYRKNMIQVVIFYSDRYWCPIFLLCIRKNVVVIIRHASFVHYSCNALHKGQPLSIIIIIFLGHWFNFHGQNVSIALFLIFYLFAFF